MEEITMNIEKYRSYLINLISSKKGLTDFEILKASENLDRHLNIYHKELKTQKSYSKRQV